MEHTEHLTDEEKTWAQVSFKGTAVRKLCERLNDERKCGFAMSAELEVSRQRIAVLTKALMDLMEVPDVQGWPETEAAKYALEQ